MRILILLLLPFLIFAKTPRICLENYWSHSFGCHYTVPMLPTLSADIRYYHIAPLQGVLIYKHYLVSDSIPNINSGLYSRTCVLHKAPLLDLNEILNHKIIYGESDYVFPFSRLAFCKKKPGYVYINKGNYWYPVTNPNASPICPADYIYNPSTSSCAPKPKCNLTCSVPGQILDTTSCVCKCAPALTNENGECVPNTNLNQAACKKAGGIYLEKVSAGDLFSNPKYAYLVMHVPLFTSHLCYTSDYVNKALNKIKDALSPVKVLSGAIAMLPIGKIKYLWKGEELTQEISRTAKNPKVLQDKQPVIDTKYNPDTGTYEPVVNLKPRENPLSPNTLLQAPKDTTTAQELVSTDPKLKELLDSPFVTKGDISTQADLTDAVTEFNMDHNLRAGAQPKIADDLREIFNRSKPQEKTNFPISIKDNVGEDPEIPAQVQRSVTPVPNKPNAYNVEYVIKPQGASKPVTINYYVTKAATSSAPAGAASAAPEIVATPTYQLGQTKYVGKEIVIKKAPTTTIPKTAPSAKESSAKPTPKAKVNYNSFVTPTESAITTAFNYKISLFTCPNVSPKCPDPIEINWNNMGIKGKYTIPDPMCAAISAIDNPKISPVIATAGNLIVLVAGILGALSLFRRN